MKRIYLSLLLLSFLVLASSLAAAQGKVRSVGISNDCPVKSFESSISLEPTGELILTPCPGMPNILNNSVMFRKNVVDPYSYGFSFDSLSNFDGNGSASNFYTEFNVENAAVNGVYRNQTSIFNLTTPTNIAAALGVMSSMMKTGTGVAHDIQAIQGSTTVTDGRVSSGIYGLVGSTGVFGGYDHGDIADLRVGGSTVMNTNARSYSGIWITRPTINNANFAGPVLALRIDSALRTPGFTVDHDGQMRIVNPVTPASSSAPCQIGQIAWDPDFVYVCVAANTWRRTQLSTW